MRLFTESSERPAAAQEPQARDTPPEAPSDAADLQRERAEKRAMQVLLAGHERMLAMMTQQVPLAEVLELLCRTVEEMTPDGRTATILLADDAGVALRHAAGRRSPAEYTSRLDAVPIGPSHGACGTAAFRVLPVVTADIASDPLWADHAELRELALSQGLRACWSVPILSPRGTVLGTFAVYHGDPHCPTPEELELSQQLARGAGVGIDLYRSREALLEADRNKDAFFATLAHELRNSLAPVASAIHLLQSKGPPDPQLVRAREMIVRQVKQMTRLVDDISDVSRIRSGKLVLHRELVELEPVVARAADTARPLIEERGHRFSVSLPPDPVRLQADPARLVQVLGNLLTNAAKYTPPAGQIWVVADRHPDRVEIRVRDTGIGMTPELVARAFDRFAQGDRKDLAYGGLGLGLALVRDLVALHGGSVQASSPGPDQGSEFIVRLPFPSPGPE